ncbi:MAG: uncharacterized protein A8A55_1216 [Amphiamblys sp. WSBS2006]|nr:MAG: uncharacterized protein A8A55_1216 [Amphiamblys sp. WSBS2006]
MQRRNAVLLQLGELFAAKKGCVGKYIKILDSHLCSPQKDRGEADWANRLLSLLYLLDETQEREHTLHCDSYLRWFDGFLLDKKTMQPTDLLGKPKKEQRKVILDLPPLEALYLFISLKHETDLGSAVSLLGGKEKTEYEEAVMCILTKNIAGVLKNSNSFPMLAIILLDEEKNTGCGVSNTQHKLDFFIGKVIEEAEYNETIALLYVQRGSPEMKRIVEEIFEYHR